MPLEKTIIKGVDILGINDGDSKFFYPYPHIFRSHISSKNLFCIILHLVVLRGRLCQSMCAVTPAGPLHASLGNMLASARSTPVH